MSESIFGDGISWKGFADEALNEKGYDATKIAFSYSEKREIIDHILKHVNVGPGVSVLDAGCNIGRWSELLRKHGFGCYHGIDQSEYSINVAKMLYPNVKFEKMFLWDMAFNEKFDFLFCNNVLQHNIFDEKLRILPKFFEALKKGGTLFLNESTVKSATPTQLSYSGWISLVEGHGFTFLESWQTNIEGLDECYLFRK